MLCVICDPCVFSQWLIKPLRCLFSCCVRAIDINLNSTARKCAAGQGSLYWWQGSRYHYQHEGLALEPSGLPSWPGWARHVYSQASRVAATPAQPLQPLWPKSSESNHSRLEFQSCSFRLSWSFIHLSVLRGGVWVWTYTDSFAFTYNTGKLFGHDLTWFSTQWLFFWVHPGKPEHVPAKLGCDLLAVLALLD